MPNFLLTFYPKFLYRTRENSLHQLTRIAGSSVRALH